MWLLTTICSGCNTKHSENTLQDYAPLAFSLPKMIWTIRVYCHGYSQKENFTLLCLRVLLDILCTFSVTRKTLSYALSLNKMEKGKKKIKWTPSTKILAVRNLVVSVLQKKYYWPGVCKCCLLKCVFLGFGYGYFIRSPIPVRLTR